MSEKTNGQSEKEFFISHTDHFEYGCDGGALTILVNGMNLHIQNCTGDGDGTVYITDKEHFELQSPFQDELMLSFGGFDTDDQSITIGLRALGIVTDNEPEMWITAKYFSISRIRGTKDFIIRAIGRTEVQNEH